MAENILMIVGSPREKGNTFVLGEAFVQGARESGNKVTVYPVGGMNIRGCLDCKYCFTHEGKCVQKDDMQLIYPALQQADMLVIASPVYFFGLTAQTKAFIDRMYSCAQKGFNIKSMALLTLCGDTDSSVLAPGIDTYKQMVRYANLEDRGIITATNVNDKGDIRGHEAIEKARELGRSIR